MPTTKIGDQDASPWPRESLDQFRRELGGDVLHRRQPLRLVIAESGPLQRVAGLQVPERRVVVAEVGERLAHREMGGDLLFGLELIDMIEQAPQSRQAAIVRLELAHVRQIEVDRRLVGRQFDGAFERRRGFLEAAERLISHTQIVAGPEAFGLDLERPEVLCDRLFQAIELEQGVAEIAIGVGIVRTACNRPLVVLDAALGMALSQQDIGQIVVGLGVVRAVVENLEIAPGRLDVLAGGIEQVAEREMRIEMLRLVRNRAVERRHRFVALALALQQHGVGIEDAGVIGRERKRCQVMPDRGVEPAGRGFDRADAAMGFRRFAIDGNGAREIGLRLVQPVGVGADHAEADQGAEMIGLGRQDEAEQRRGIRRGRRGPAVSWRPRTRARPQRPVCSGAPADRSATTEQAARRWEEPHSPVILSVWPAP